MHSTGWRNMLGLPVEESVAAIFLPIIPDLPMPITIILPFVSRSFKTAFANVAFNPREEEIMACASWRKMKLANFRMSFFVENLFFILAELCAGKAMASFPEVFGVCYRGVEVCAGET